MSLNDPSRWRNVGAAARAAGVGSQCLGEHAEAAHAVAGRAAGRGDADLAGQSRMERAPAVAGKAACAGMVGGGAAAGVSRSWEDLGRFTTNAPARPLEAINMNDEPRSELGQQQGPTVPTGPASSPEPVPASGSQRPPRRRRLLVASAVGVSVLLVSRQPPSVGRGTPTTTTAASAGGTTSPAGSAEADSKD